MLVYVRHRIHMYPEALEAILFSLYILSSDMLLLVMQRNMIREATAFLLDVLKPNLPEHALLQTKVCFYLLHAILSYNHVHRALTSIILFWLVGSFWQVPLIYISVPFVSTAFLIQ
jgi:hypothetical protein